MTTGLQGKDWKVEEKRKPYLTISFRQPRHSLVVLFIMLSIGLIAGAFGIQEFQRWQKQILETEARLHDTESELTQAENRFQMMKASLEAVETKLQETEAELLDSKRKLEAYLPISLLNEPIAFISTKWGIDAIACTKMPEGYTGAGDELGEGRLLYYYATEWDTVEAIDQSDQYKFVGEDEWGANWDEDEGFDNWGYYMHVAVLESHPFTWSKSKDWLNNKDGWESRLTVYCRDTLQP